MALQPDGEEFGFELAGGEADEVAVGHLVIG
jgi:hypothetical protein